MDKELNNRFPEVDGDVLGLDINDDMSHWSAGCFIPASSLNEKFQWHLAGNGGRPETMMLDEAGKLSLTGPAKDTVQQGGGLFSQIMAGNLSNPYLYGAKNGDGGAEPSVLTAMEYAEKIEAMPEWMRENILGEDHERILGELKEQGHEVAVIENPPIEPPSLLDGIKGVMHNINLNIQKSQQVMMSPGAYNSMIDNLPDFLIEKREMTKAEIAREYPLTPDQAFKLDVKPEDLPIIPNL